MAAQPGRALTSIWPRVTPLFHRPARAPGSDYRRVYQVIQLHTAAPTKPAEGAPCNGCGVCCASAPCPAGALVSRRLHGACDALEWAEEAGAYRCGLIEHPVAHLPAALRWTAPLLGRAARRLIAAGSGCDCSVSVGEDAR